MATKNKNLDVLARAMVSIWGEHVGEVTEYTDGRIGFEYAKSFRDSGLELSPVNLPLSASGVFQFPELIKSAMFMGLPGVLCDSLPDTFGNLVIKNYFTSRGEPEKALSPVQRLLYIGSRAMGALEFAPGIDRELGRHETEALEVKLLVEAARKLVEGNPDKAIPDMLQIGASAGGARAKALILWSQNKNRIRSAFVAPEGDEESWLIKFDGVNSANPLDRGAKPFNRVEFTYALLAKKLNIVMSPVSFIEGSDGLFHFMTQRFDRTLKSGERIHMHSLGGMEHVDFNIPGVYSYEAWFRLIQKMEMGADVLRQAFQRAVFNIVGCNRDDHVKNISFLMDRKGQWSLSPAYDLTHAHGAGYTVAHQMQFANKRKDITREDVLKIGKSFDIKNPAEIYESTQDVFSRWPDLAKQWDIPKEMIDAISKDHAVPGYTAVVLGSLIGDDAKLEDEDTDGDEQVAKPKI